MLCFRVTRRKIEIVGNFNIAGSVSLKQSKNSEPLSVGKSKVISFLPNIRFN